MPDNDKEASRTPQTVSPLLASLTRTFYIIPQQKGWSWVKSEIPNIYKLNEADQINNVSLWDGSALPSNWSISAEYMMWKIFTK